MDSSERGSYENTLRMRIFIIDKLRLMWECTRRFQIATDIGEDLHYLVTIIADASKAEWLLDYYIERVLYSDELFNGHHEPLGDAEREELRQCCIYIWKYIDCYLDAVGGAQSFVHVTPSSRNLLRFVYNDQILQRSAVRSI